MSFWNAVKGGGLGALLGGGAGFLLGGGPLNPFLSIPLAIAGAKVGGGVGAIAGAFKPDYPAIQQVYHDPYAGNAYSTQRFLNYDGMNMPQQLVAPRQGVGSSLLTAGAGFLAGSMLSRMFCGFPMYGMGMGMGGFGMPYGLGMGLWGNQGFNMGGFTWGLPDPAGLPILW